MKYYFEFEVTGRGEFPWDMLRHSRLFPLYTEDAHNLPSNPDGNPRHRTIKLGMYSNTSCSDVAVVERFASFLWTAECTLEERL